MTSFGLDLNQGIQKVHLKKSYRLGGLFIFLSILISFLLNHAVLELEVYLLGFIPVFFIGFLEDVYKENPVSLRLTLILISSTIIVLGSGSIILDADLKFFNAFLQIPFMPYFFTIIGITVTANSWNLIDGLNGVSSGLSSIVLFLIGYLAYNENLLFINNIAWLFASATLGFFLVNILTGRVFLGDSGALTIGAVIGWTGVELATKINNVSTWVVFFIIIYPAIEIIFSFFRRLSNRKSPTKADNLHLHSLLYFYLRKKFFEKHENSISGLLIVFLSSLPSAFIYFYGLNYINAIIGTFVFTFFYLLIYYYLFKFRKKFILV